MNVWFVVYFFGHIVSYVGPFNGGSDNIQQALEKCHYGEAMFAQDLEDSKDDLKNHPLPNGIVVTVNDIKIACILQNDAPVIDDSFGIKK